MERMYLRRSPRPDRLVRRLDRRTLRPRRARLSRRRALWLALLGGLVALGLLAPLVVSSGGTDPAEAADPVGTHALDEQGLRGALLDPMDFPAGWASDSRKAAEQRGIGVPRPQEAACGELFESGEEITARAGFARTQSGPFVTTVAAVHESPADAARAVAAFRETVAEDCDTFHDSEGPAADPLTVAYRLGEPDALETELERLGEADADSAALRYHRKAPEGAAEVGGTAVIADVMIVRVGTHTVRVTQAGRDDAGTGSVAEIAARAVDKLQEVCAGQTPTPDPDQPGTTEL
ncbi:hypothetical protein [Streptomyces sp. B6B3]|uniref:hypothetical protein n=1 Tax=Streptomyces sp. B6B3 TaxID=3153570 RepID=UPI00325E7C34